MGNNSKSKRSILVVVVVILVAVIVGVMHSRNSNPSGQANKVALRLKWLYTAHTAAGPAAALKNGYFEDQNLDVTINPGGFEFDSVILVANGSENFGVKGADDVIIARSKGVPLVAIAMDYQLNPVCYMSMPDSGITKPQDFVGKKVGMKFGQNTTTFYEAMMGKMGIDRSQITEVPVKFDLTPLLTKQVDVYHGCITFEPAILANKNVTPNIILAHDQGIRSYGNVLFTTEKQIQENPEMVQRFVSAYVRGWEWSIEHPEGTAAILSQLNEQFSESIQLDMMQRTIPFIKPAPETIVGSMTMQGWQETQDVLVQQGIIDKPIDLNATFTTQFVDQYQKSKVD